MNKIFIIIVMLLPFLGIGAQTLTGTIYDAKTKQPIPEVFVYLDGTSIHTITNARGEFNLVVGKRINTKLILHHISYQPVVVLNPFEKLSDKFYLEEMANSLTAVVIEADQISREKKMKAFREQFLGQTISGKSCKILNEDDIRLIYRADSKTLVASSNKPIIIRNSYLGYEVLFTLVDFRIKYHTETLNSEDIQQTYFAGVSAFTDISSNRKRIKDRRDNVYKTSSAYFFKNFVNHTLDSANYRVFNGRSRIDPDVYFAIKDTLSQKLVQIRPNTDLAISPRSVHGYMYGIIDVVYNKRKQSEISFLINSFSVDLYGNIDAIDKVLYKGSMGAQRAGDMLPLEYEL